MELSVRRWFAAACLAVAVNSTVAAADGSFTFVQSMKQFRRLHTATLMADGRVLVTGGVPIAAAALSEIYVGQQDSYTHLVQQTVPAIFAPDTFRPESQRESLQVIRWLIVEVEGRERFVRDIYKQHLPRLQAATGD